MSLRFWQGLCALLIVVVVATASLQIAGAQQRGLEGQIVVKSDGTLYLIQNGLRYVVNAVSLPDDLIDQIPSGGAVTALVGQVPAASVQFDPKAQQPRTAAELVLGSYWALGQWDRAYALMHPDQQARVPRDVFVDIMRGAATAFTITAAEAGSPETVADWTDPLTGKSYDSVTRVPVNLTIQRSNGPEKITYDLHLAKVGDYWRWFWQPPGG
jgi:hypothetical protein